MKQTLHAPSVRYPLLEKYRDEISRCVRCGSCRAVCPSFLVNREESRSARGRMALVGAVLEGRLPVSDIFKDRLATCTTCLACEASCASGVRVTEIIQAAKEQAIQESGPGLIKKVLAAILKSRQGLQATSWLAPIALHYSMKSVKKSSMFRIPSSDMRKSGKKSARGTVVFFPGCAIDHFQPDIGGAARNVLNAIGYEVVVPAGFSCCGRPLLSLGDRRAAEELADRNNALFAACNADAVVTACASCGLTFKREYPTLLPPGSRPVPVFDIHEFLAAAWKNTRMAPVEREITIHDPCHLGRGQGLSPHVRDLLLRVPGLSIREMKNPDRCCGFGGVMRVTHPRLSNSIADEKIKTILATGSSGVATGCPSCRMQISDGLRRAGSGLPVFHPVQILEEALRTNR